MIQQKNMLKMPYRIRFSCLRGIALMLVFRFTGSLLQQPLNAWLVTMLSTDLFVWLWISKIWLIINDGIKRTTLWAEIRASRKRLQQSHRNVCQGRIRPHFYKVFLASYFLYPFKNYFRRLLWITRLKYLFIMGFCVRLHNPVEFSSYLPFLIPRKRW